MNALFPPPADTSTIKLRVLSLGTGVQSTTLTPMAAHGAQGERWASIPAFTLSKSGKVQPRTGSGFRCPFPRSGKSRSWHLTNDQSNVTGACLLRLTLRENTSGRA